MNNVPKPWERKDILRLRPYWQDIAFDIINTRTPLPDGSINVTMGQVCEAYSMTEQECHILLQMPEFGRVLRDTQRRVDAMGENAAIMLRAQALAVPIMEQVAADVLKPNADTKDRLNALKIISNIGNLDPSTNGTNKQRSDGAASAGGTVSTVNFIIPNGIPGIEHVRPKVVGDVVDGEIVNGDK